LVTSFGYDINANETGTGLKLNIDDLDNSLDIDLLLKTAPYYLISEKRATEIKDEVINAVSNWRKIAAKHKAAPSEIERKARAFKFY